MRFLNLLLALIALVVLPRSALGEATPYYKELVKSKPVEINGLEFVAATEAQWLVLNSSQGSTSVDVQLWITNRTERDLLFPVFDTFRVIIKNASGKELPLYGRRDGTLIAKPVLIHPGETYCLSRTAVFAWHPDGTRTFGYEDGTGSIFILGPKYPRPGLGGTLSAGPPGMTLVPGKYTLSFSVFSKGEDEEMKVFVNHHGFSGKLPPCWEGKGNTADASFEVVDPFN